MPGKERKDVMNILSYFHIDMWTLWGLVSQGLFFLSFVVQWYESEKRKTSVIPMEFWYLRILGALMTFIYAVARRDIVFLASTVLQIIIYSRNIHLISLKAPAGKG